MTFRTVSVDMWRKDDWFADLAPDAKLVWIYSFTNDSTSPAGIYQIALRTIANDTGIPLKRVKDIIAEFSAAGKLYYENGIIWPVTMRKHQTGKLKSTDNLVKKINKDLAELPDCPLLKRYREYYRVSIVYPEGIDALPEPQVSPLEGPSEGLAIPSRDTRHLTQDTHTDTTTQTHVNGANTAPLDACLAELPQAKNKGAVVGKLFTARFGATYPPNYGRLGKLAKQLSGDYTALAQLIWASSTPQGDPHDYLTRMVQNSPASIAHSDNGSGPDMIIVHDHDRHVKQFYRLTDSGKVLDHEEPA